MYRKQLSIFGHLIAIIVPLILILTGTATIIVSATGYAQEEHAQASKEQGGKGTIVYDKIISENTLIPLGLVITIVGLVASVVVNFTESKIHRSNSDIHHTTGELKELFVEKDCVKEIKDSITKLEESINEIKIEMVKNFAKLERSINGK